MFGDEDCGEAKLRCNRISALDAQLMADAGLQ